MPFNLDRSTIEDHQRRMSGQVPRFQGANISFGYEWLKDEAASLKEGRPIYAQREMLTVHFPGQDITVREVQERDKIEYKELYQDFLEREKEPTSGTPLKEWSLMPRSTVEELKFFHIRTVEELVAFTVADDPRHRVIELWQKRGQSLLKANKDAKNQVVALTEINEKHEARIEKMQERILLLQSRIEASEGVRLNGPNGLNL